MNVHKRTRKLIRSSCQILMKVDFSRQIFVKKSSNHIENPLSGSRVIACGQTDGRTEISKLFLQI